MVHAILLEACVWYVRTVNFTRSLWYMRYYWKPVWYTLYILPETQFRSPISIMISQVCPFVRSFSIHVWISKFMSQPDSVLLTVDTVMYCTVATSNAHIIVDYVFCLVALR